METNEIIITSENYKQKLSELDELRKKQYELMNNKDVNDTKSIVKLFDMLDERHVIDESYDGHQSEIDKLTEQMELYCRAFENYRGVIQETIRKCESDIKDIENKLQNYKSIENDVNNGLSKKALYSMYKQLVTGEIKTGSVIMFGSYPQGKSSKDKTPIEWIVLDIQDGKALLISKMGIDCKPYHKNYYGHITWENCSLRKWLNGAFLNKAFNDNEKEMIKHTIVTADNNPRYNTNPGNDTKDKVFLLSINEVKKYFHSNKYKSCKPTIYAREHGADRDLFSGNCYWLLRSPGASPQYAAYVYSGVNNEGNVNGSYYTVRPALWISLDVIWKE